SRSPRPRISRGVRLPAGDVSASGKASRANRTAAAARPGQRPCNPYDGTGLGRDSPTDRPPPGPRQEKAKAKTSLMSQGYKTPQAQRDLVAIGYYLAEHSPIASERFSKRSRRVRLRGSTLGSISGDCSG